MNMLNTNLQTFFKRAGYLALACGLLAPAVVRAQSSYSSSSNDYALNNPSSSSPQYSSSDGGQQYNNPQYNNPNQQYGNNPQYGNNQQYGNRTPRYTGHSWADHFIVEAGAGGTAGLRAAPRITQTPALTCCWAPVSGSITVSACWRNGTITGWVFPTVSLRL